MKCKCGSEEFIGIEYTYNHPGYYDGISEWKCENCGTRYGRWTKQELTDGAYEPVYGGKK